MKTMKTGKELKSLKQELLKSLTISELKREIESRPDPDIENFLLEARRSLASVRIHDRESALRDMNDALQNIEYDYECN